MLLCRGRVLRTMRGRIQSGVVRTQWITSSGRFVRLLVELSGESCSLNVYVSSPVVKSAAEKLMFAWTGWPAPLGANPLPIVVPCHRILHAGGGLGGYTGGLARKRTLLAIEAR